MEQGSNGADGTPNQSRIWCLIGGEWRDSKERFDVVDPYSGLVVAQAPVATAQDVADAVDAAVAARPSAAVPGYQRAELLRRVQALIRERGDDIDRAITRETGKAIKPDIEG